MNYDIMWERITCNQPDSRLYDRIKNMLLVIDLHAQRKNDGRQRDKETAI